jgi:hypothetical protein
MYKFEYVNGSTDMFSIVGAFVVFRLVTLRSELNIKKTKLLKLTLMYISTY